MDINVTGGVIGVVCLGFASLATFLLVPDRELTARERIGIHTIFWTFAVYAMWTISTISDARGPEKILYVSIPVLLGLILSLLSEFRVKRPTLEISDTRLRAIAVKTWNKLPHNVQKGLQSTILLIKEIPQWTDLDDQYLHDPKINAVKWFPILPLPARGIIHISKSDCEKHADTVIMSSMARELARAYQTTRTPFDSDKIDEAGAELPARWGYK